MTNTLKLTGIYAAGDITGEIMLANIALVQGNIVGSEATELIHEAVVIMRTRGTIDFGWER